MSTAPLSLAARPDRIRSVLALAGWLALCFGAATFGALFMPGEWYAQLRKPSWNPPSWLFGPVWTALYFMMASAAWLVWRRGGFAANLRPLSLFLAQLVFNALWSWLFFGLKNPALAFVDIVCLWLGILMTLLSFWNVHRTAAVLLAPYLAWVSFAAVLNGTLWYLNR